MREYETVYITNPDLTDAQVGDVSNKVQRLVEKNGGTFFFNRPMGKRKLAYTINKQNRGIYFCADYASEGPTVSEIERTLRFDENVIRFLTVVKSEQVDVEARKAEIAARGEDSHDVSGESTERGTDASDEQTER